MNIIPRHKALLRDFVFFLSLGGIFWTINVVGQSSFPGDHVFPVLIRLVIQLGLLALCYYANYKFSRKNALSDDFLKFRPKFILKYLSGSVLAGLIIAMIWAIVYLFYPFEIIRNVNSRISFMSEISSYGLGNTLEELLFRGFLLIASIKLFGKRSGVLLVSLLFGLFHLQGTGLTSEGISMVMTTFTMSLLLVSVIFYTKSIWTAVALHITGNILLHTLGFDGAGSGLFFIKFASTNISGHLLSLVFEIVVITFASSIFFRTAKLLK